MNHLPLSMSNVLFGSVHSTLDAAAIGDRYRAAGGDSERLVVLRGQSGVDALRRSADGGSLMSGWARRARRTFDTIAAHIVDTAVDGLKNGDTVLVVLEVDSRNADADGRRLQRLGATHLHHSGRWTSVEHGTVPSPRASLTSTAA